MNQTTLDKIISAEKELAQKRGEFRLFGLFRREDAPGTWDVVVSAPWFSSEKRRNLQVISDALQRRLTQDELVELSRIVVVEPENPEVEAISKAFRVTHGQVEVRDSQLFGLAIKHAFIITASNGRRSSAGHAAASS